MSQKYFKKKQPEQVRARLLEVAAKHIGTDGARAIRLEAVAREAGVTKGGLLHHFPSKNALLEGLYIDRFTQFEEQIEELIASDPVAHGCFTRAYLRAASLAASRDDTASFFALVLSSKDFKARTLAWMEERLKRHAKTDTFPEAQVVLFAADGLLMSMLLDDEEQLLERREATRATLLAMTYPKES